MKETKVFDPADGFGALTGVSEVTDASVVKRGDRWWMYLACDLAGQGIQLTSASLPAGRPLSAGGWTLSSEPGDPTRVALLAGHERSAAWDLKGGRHCPSYVRGRDPHSGRWVERLYYAGGAQDLWGPYAIGYLEWDGQRWVDQADPAFVPSEEWEHGSVYEPNLIYHDGTWKMWYVAGSNREGYLVQGYAESADGRGAWSRHEVFVPTEEKVFDFCVIEVNGGYEAVFSRVWLAAPPAPAATGLWWCRADRPAARFSDWSRPVQIMTAADRGWHSGPWKPSARYAERDSTRLHVFFDGLYDTGAGGGFPFAFTLGCLELERPAARRAHRSPPR